MEQYGLGLIMELSDRDLQTVLFEGDGNTSQRIARAIFIESADVQAKVLANIHEVRRREVERLMREMTKALNGMDAETFLKRDGFYRKNSCEAMEQINSTVVTLQQTGKIFFHEGNWSAPPTHAAIGIKEGVDDLVGQAVETFRERQVEDLAKIGEFNLQAMTREDILNYWLPVASIIRRQDRLFLDLVAEKIIDNFSRYLFDLMLDDFDDGIFVDVAERLRRTFVNEYERRLEIMHMAIVLIRSEHSPMEIVFYYRSILPFDALPDSIEEIIERSHEVELSKQITTQKLIEQIVFFSHLAESNGIMGLEKYLEDRNLDPYFRLCLQLTVDGCEFDDADQVLLTKKKALLADLNTKIEMFVTLCRQLRSYPSPYYVELKLSAYIAETRVR